jgi:hypothetical protein
LRFTDNLEDIPTWECGLAQVIVPTAFHFPEFVHMCAQSYDPIKRVVKSKNNQYILFPVSKFAISEILLLPDNQERLDEDELGTYFNSIPLEQNLSFLLKLLPIGASLVELKFPLSSFQFKESIREITATICLILGYD